MWSSFFLGIAILFTGIALLDTLRLQFLLRKRLRLLGDSLRGLDEAMKELHRELQGVRADRERMDSERAAFRYPN